MGKLSSIEASSLHSWRRRKGIGLQYIAGSLVKRDGSPNGLIENMSVEQMAKLKDALPKGKTSRLTSPILWSIRRKLARAIDAKGGVQPHQEAPETWPQAYRMMMHLNNKRGGLRRAGGGQWVKLNPKAMKVSLRGTHRWTQEKGGDLIIMGTWSQISAALGNPGLRFSSEFGDIYKGDVNMEFDRMYGDLGGEELERLSKMPLAVEVTSGVGFSETEDEGEVVLDPRGEIVKLVGDKIVGIAGAAGPESLGHEVLDKINDVKGFIEDHVIPVGEKVMEVHESRREAKIHKTHLTVTVGVGASGSNAEIMGERFTGVELSEAVNRLRGTA